jgi:hypothetical protein
MSLRLDQLLNACTVRIKVPGTKSHGTGFFFAPGLILTCYHVVEKSFGEFVEVFPNGHSQSIQAKIRCHFPKNIDLIILEADIKDQYKFPCVLLGEDIQPKDNCYAYGYTDYKQGNPEGDPVTLECEGLTGGEISNIKLKGGQVRPGLSGSPLLNFNTGKVCGVVKFTRADSFDLGGGAVPINFVFSEFPVLEKLHNDYHKLNRQWIELLKFDTDAFDSDWTYLDEEAKKFANYTKSIFFLIKVAFRWFIWGHKAPRAFPMGTIALLIEHTFKKDLGQEIKRQRKELTRKLTFDVDPEGCNQAKILNEIDSQAQVISHLINMLVSNEQDLASASRLLWVTEVLYEQRDLIEELKKKEGNSYPKLESFKKRFKILNNIEDEKYINVDRIIGRLVARYTDNTPIIFSSLQHIFTDSIDILHKNPNLQLIYIENLYIRLKIIFLNLSTPVKFSVDSLLDDLDKEIRRNPKIKVLRKLKFLVETVAGELVQG